MKHFTGCKSIGPYLAVLLLLVSAPGLCKPTEDKAASSISIVLKARGGLDVKGREAVCKCEYLRLDISGTFAHNFTYRFRQRFNKPITDGNFLSATDYLWVGWGKNGWGVSAGKDYVACGGFDYQTSSYDLYIRPVFFNGLGGMYNFVINGYREFCGEKLTLQFSNSLYSLKPSNLLGCSILLKGRQGIWEHAYSVNLFEREKGLHNFYVCLGNRFHIDGSTLDLGLVHRIDTRAPAFFKDFSIVGKFKVPALRWMNVFGKVTWDFKEEGVADPMLPDGTNIWQAGGGFEFFPTKEFKGLRLHCVYYNQNGTLNCILAGISLTLDILDAIGAKTR